MLAVCILKVGKTTVREKDGTFVRAVLGTKVVVDEEYCESNPYLEALTLDDDAEGEAARKAEQDKAIADAKAQAVEDYKAEQAALEVEKAEAAKLNDETATENAAVIKKDAANADSNSEDEEAKTPKGRKATALNAAKK